MDKTHHLVGIGVGPFNLSLAALLDKAPSIHSVFLERKAQFDWHPEVMFPDSNMQTSYLKDLVTPVDPTSRYSFLNYLADKHLLYPFLNTQRSIISRREFEQYCAWVSRRLGERLRLGQPETRAQVEIRCRSEECGILRRLICDRDFSGEL